MTYAELRALDVLGDLLLTEGEFGLEVAMPLGMAETILEALREAGLRIVEDRP